MISRKIRGEETEIFYTNSIIRMPGQKKKKIWNSSMIIDKDTVKKKKTENHKLDTAQEKSSNSNRRFYLRDGKGATCESL